MIPTSTLLTEYQKHTRDTTSANQTLGQNRMQYYYEVVLAETNNYIAELTKYGNATADQRSYLFPPGYIKLKTIRFYVGSTWYEVEEEPNLTKWFERTATAYTSTIPSKYHVFNEASNLHFELDPIPSDDGTNNIEIVYEGQQDPLTFPGDYSTGTVTIANGSATITGSGSAFTTAMVGRFIKPTGAKHWYDIKGYTSVTVMTLVNYFQETSVSGVAYTIAEMPRIPPEFHMTPVWGAVMDYYLPTSRIKYMDYKGRYDADLAKIAKRYQNKTKGSVLVGRQVSSFGSVTPRNYPHVSLSRQ